MEVASVYQVYNKEGVEDADRGRGHVWKCMIGVARKMGLATTATWPRSPDRQQALSPEGHQSSHPSAERRVHEDQGLGQLDRQQEQRPSSHPAGGSFGNSSVVCLLFEICQDFSSIRWLFLQDLLGLNVI